MLIPLPSEEIKEVKDEKGNKCYDIVFNFKEVLPSTVCQYTGLTDKNGAKIFKGDKICVKSYKGTIIFTEGYWKIKWQENYHLRTDLQFFCTDKEIDIEVTGTIFDKGEAP